jgi:hypothetical protein
MDHDGDQADHWWMTKIVQRSLRRYDEEGDGNIISTVLSYKYRTEWNDTTEKTWVDEDDTGEDSGFVVRKYIQKNSAAIAREVHEKLLIGSNVGATFRSRYFRLNQRTCTVFRFDGEESPADEDEDAYAVDDAVMPGQPVDPGCLLTLVMYFSKVVKGNGEFETTLEFNRSGITLLTRDEIARLFGFLSDATLFLFSGLTVASHDEFGHFTMAPVVLQTDAAYCLAGTHAEPLAGAVEEKTKPRDVVWESPIEPADEMLYSEFLHASAWMFLTTGVVPSDYSRTPKMKKNFKQNVRRRFKVEEGELWYNRGRRARTGFPRQITSAHRPYVMIPRMGRMWAIIEEDHRQHHDGHNRAEMRLDLDYFIPGKRAYIEYAHTMCKDVCQIWDRMPKGVVIPIITSRPLQLLMFDLFFFPCADSHGNTICCLAVDHFTKFKWGCVLSDKTAAGVVDFLRPITNAEGNAERWHCDNGGEFKNAYMKKLQDELNVRSMMHGKALHPQTQGLVERANGQVKKRIQKIGLELGQTHANQTFDWSDILAVEAAEDRPNEGENGILCRRSAPGISGAAPHGRTANQLFQ